MAAPRSETHVTLQIRQRDSEISVLMALLERQKALGSSWGPPVSSSAPPVASVERPAAALSNIAREAAAGSVQGGRKATAAGLGAKPGSVSSLEESQPPAVGAGVAQLPQNQPEPEGKIAKEGGKLLPADIKNPKTASIDSGAISPGSKEVAPFVPLEENSPITASQQPVVISGKGSGGEHPSKTVNPASTATNGTSESSTRARQAHVSASTMAGGSDTACTRGSVPGQPGGTMGGNEVESSAQASKAGKIANTSNGGKDGASPRAFEAFTQQYGPVKELQRLRSELGKRCQVAQALGQEVRTCLVVPGLSMNSF